MFPAIAPVAGAVAMDLATRYAPGLVRWLTGSDRAADVAGAVAAAATRATGGAADPVAALAADPEALARFVAEARAIELEQYRAETERLTVVNETIRAEAASGDAFTRRWRPTWGYVTAATWALQAVGILACLLGAVAATVRGETAAVTALMGGAAELAGALSLQWAVALAVLGVAVQARSADKAVKLTGEAPPPGLLGALAARIAGGGR